MESNQDAEIFPNSLIFSTKSESAVLTRLRRRRSPCEIDDDTWSSFLRDFPCCVLNWRSMKVQGAEQSSMDWCLRCVIDTINGSGVIFVQICSVEQVGAIRKQERRSDTILKELFPAVGHSVPSDAALASLTISCKDCDRKLLDASFPPHRIVLPCVKQVVFDLGIFTKNCCILRVSDSDTESEDSFDSSDRNALRMSSNNEIVFTVEIVRHQETVPDVLNKLYDKSLLSDLTIKVGHTELRAHRCVLAASSTVFQSMFENNFAESLTGIVNIADFGRDVVEAALRYMYGKDIRDLNASMFIELLVFAEKYELLELKDLCERRLSLDTSVDAFQLLVLADTNNAHLLKEAIISRIVGHPNKKSILKESSALALIDSHSKLFVELLLRM